MPEVDSTQEAGARPGHSREGVAAARMGCICLQQLLDHVDTWRWHRRKAVPCPGGVAANVPAEVYLAGRLL